MCGCSALHMWFDRIFLERDQYFHNESIGCRQQNESEQQFSTKYNYGFRAIIPRNICICLVNEFNKTHPEIVYISNEAIFVYWNEWKAITNGNTYSFVDLIISAS